MKVKCRHGGVREVFSTTYGREEEVTSEVGKQCEMRPESHRFHRDEMRPESHRFHRDLSSQSSGLSITA